MLIPCYEGHAGLTRWIVLSEEERRLELVAGSHDVGVADIVGHARDLAHHSPGQVREVGACTHTQQMRAWADQHSTGKQTTQHHQPSAASRVSVCFSLQDLRTAAATAFSAWRRTLGGRGIDAKQACVVVVGVEGHEGFAQRIGCKQHAEGAGHIGTWQHKLMSIAC